MQADPDELNNLAGDPGFAKVQKRRHQQMPLPVDPENVNRQALADQASLSKKPGGVEAILGSEEFDFTPVG
jgi:choline-sulfatase